jgi:hypothetical protein
MRGVSWSGKLACGRRRRYFEDHLLPSSLRQRREWRQSKAYYLFPHKVEGGLIFYYGSYRDYWNPDLNGVLRTFNVYVGRTW